MINCLSSYSVANVMALDKLKNFIDVVIIYRNGMIYIVRVMIQTAATSRMYRLVDHDHLLINNFVSLKFTFLYIPSMLFVEKLEIFFALALAIVHLLNA